MSGLDVRSFDPVALSLEFAGNLFKHRVFPFGAPDLHPPEDVAEEAEKHADIYVKALGGHAQVAEAKIEWRWVDEKWHPTIMALLRAEIKPSRSKAR